MYSGTAEFVERALKSEGRSMCGRSELAPLHQVSEVSVST